MNAKEQIIEIIKNEIFSTDEIELQKALITAIEAAIFDVPSEEEISNMSNDFKIGIGITASKCFEKGCNFILNYKKPKQDGK